MQGVGGGNGKPFKHSSLENASQGNQTCSTGEIGAEIVEGGEMRGELVEGCEMVG